MATFLNDDLPPAEWNRRRSLQAGGGSDPNGGLDPGASILRLHDGLPPAVWQKVRAQELGGALAAAPAGADSPAYKRARALEGGAAPVLALIPQGEGTMGDGGYDVVFGGHRYRPADTPALTSLSLDQVSALQNEMLQREGVAGAARSTAVGKYQITADTLADLKKTMNLKGTDVASAALQDRMGREILKMEKFDDYLAGRPFGTTGRPTTAADVQRGLARRFSSFAAGADDYSYYDVNGHHVTADTPTAMKVVARVKSAAIQQALEQARAEHARFLQQDSSIQQRLEDGYLPDAAPWR
jgi:hypothetical protein